MPKRRKPKVNIPMATAFVLFYLTILSTYLTGGLYAKYIVSDSASDSARVIKFGQLTVTETGDFVENGKAYFMPGVNLEKDITVEFSAAETDVYIFVAAQTPGWVREVSENKNFTCTSEGGIRLMEWQVAEKWQYLESDGDTHVYWQYVDSNNAFTDKFINGGTISVTEDGTRKIHKDLIDAAEKIQINVTAYAVQAGGFADAAEAWISLSA